MGCRLPTNSFFAVAGETVDLATALRLSIRDHLVTIDTCGGMAGSDPCGRSLATAYDAATAQWSEQFHAASEALLSIGARVHQAGLDTAVVDRNARSGDVRPPRHPRYCAPELLRLAPPVPAAGASPVDAFRTDVHIPTADITVVLRAANAWQSISDVIEQMSNMPAGQRAEIGLGTEMYADLYSERKQLFAMIGLLGQIAVRLADACRAFAEEVVDLRHKILSVVHTAAVENICGVPSINVDASGPDILTGAEPGHLLTDFDEALADRIELMVAAAADQVRRRMPPLHMWSSAARGATTSLWKFAYRPICCLDPRHESTGTTRRLS